MPHTRLARGDKYQHLIPEKIVETIDGLSERIHERFADSSLYLLSRELRELASRAHARSVAIAGPAFGLRVLAGALIAIIVAGLWMTLAAVDVPEEGLEFVEFVQVFEAGMNDLFLIGATIFFLVTLEGRVKRRKALDALHELRSVAHIIDMHQLTKDPEQLLSESERFGEDREARVRDLGRYLDFSSELLSLTGKIAALYVQEYTDAAAISAVNEIENLTTGLSRKIWQKVMLLHSTGN